MTDRRGVTRDANGQKVDRRVERVSEYFDPAKADWPVRRYEFQAILEHYFRTQEERFRLLMAADRYQRRWWRRLGRWLLRPRHPSPVEAEPGA